MWQGVWQELLENRTVYKAAETFLSSLGLDACDLPCRQVFGQFYPEQPPQKPNAGSSHDTPSSARESPEPIPAEEATPCGEGAGEGTLAVHAEETTSEDKPIVKIDDWPKSTSVFHCTARYDAGALSFLSGEEGGFLWTSKSAAPA